MQYFKRGVIPVQQGQSGLFYVNLPSQLAPIGPSTGNDEEPFDLTGVTEIVATFPNQVSERYTATTANKVAVQGAAGAGKIKVTYSALDSLNMQANPVPTQNQDLQVIVTIGGVAQIDTLSLAAGPVAGTTYSTTLNGQLFSYQAVTGDTSFSVFTQLLAQMNAYAATLAAMLPAVPWNISGALGGAADNTATLILTSTFAGLGFTDVVANLTKVASTANAGTISVFLFKFALEIQPQSYAVT